MDNDVWDLFLDTMFWILVVAAILIAALSFGAGFLLHMFAS